MESHGLNVGRYCSGSVIVSRQAPLILSAPLRPRLMSLHLQTNGTLCKTPCGSGACACVTLREGCTSDQSRAINSSKVNAIFEAQSDNRIMIRPDRHLLVQHPRVLREKQAVGRLSPLIICHLGWYASVEHASVVDVAANTAGVNLVIDLVIPPIRSGRVVVGALIQHHRLSMRSLGLRSTTQS